VAIPSHVVERRRVAKQMKELRTKVEDVSHWNVRNAAAISSRDLAPRPPPPLSSLALLLQPYLALKAD
jgi:hypothetical protein